MEELNTTIESIGAMKDDIIVQSFTTATDAMATDGMFVINNPSLTMTDNYGMCAVKLDRQYMVEDVLQKLEELINVNILYHYKTKGGGQKQKAIAYTLPVQDGMSVFGLTSCQYGIVEEINMTFFDSLDVMFRHLKNGYDFLSHLNMDIVEQQALAELYKNFI